MISIINEVFSGRVVLRSFREAPGDYFSLFINHPGSDPLCNHFRGLTYAVNGAFVSVWEAKQDGLDYFLTGLL